MYRRYQLIGLVFLLLGCTLPAQAELIRGGASGVLTNEVDAGTKALSTLVTEIGANVRTLKVSQPLPWLASATVPATTTLEVTGDGSIPCNSTGNAVNIAGELIADKRHIFTGCSSSGTTPRVNFTGNNKIKDVYSVWFGDTGDGTTNDQVFIRDAILAAQTCPNGCRVIILNGTHNLSTALVQWGDGVELVGEDKEATILLATATSALGTSSIQTSTFFAVRNLTIKTVASTPINLSSSIVKYVLDNVGCDASAGTTQSCFLSSAGASLYIHDSEFYADADGFGNGIQIQGPASDIVIERNECRGLKQCIGLNPGSTGSHRKIEIKNNRMDGLWYLYQAAYTNSGGTVTYGATTLVDTSQTFTGLTNLNYVVALTAKQVAGGTVTHAPGRITDAAATFVTAALIRGDLCYSPSTSPTKVAIVQAAISETVLHMEGWLDTTTYKHVAPPAANTSYTCYGVGLAQVASASGNTVTVSNGFATLLGSLFTPAAGTLYRVTVALAGNQLFSDAPNDALTITGNTVVRSWGDAIALQSTGGSIVCENTIEDGQDVGLTMNGKGITACQNIIKRQGSAAIWANAEESIISGNTIWDVQLRQISAGGGTCLGGIRVSNLNISVLGNTIIKNGMVSQGKGIFLASSLAQGANIEGNITQGFNSTDGGFHICSNATVTGSRVGRNTFDFITIGSTITGSVQWELTQAFTFATIPSNIANGSILYLSDGTIANPCAGSGTGSYLKRLNGVNVCN